MKKKKLLIFSFFVFILSFIPYNLLSQISLNFNSDKKTGCGNLQVNFTASASSLNGTIVSWLWDLGGTPATIPNPSRIFGTPGKYKICLTVTDNFGNSQTLCKDNEIIVYSIPQADFSVNPSSGCAPLNVTFNDISSQNNSKIVRWYWDLGGSANVIDTTVKLLNISSVYTISPGFSPKLIIIDTNNCVGSITKNIIVNAPPIIKVSTSDTFSCKAPYLVQFKNNLINSNVTYIWNFGNNQTYVGANPPPILYNQSGKFNVTVKAINNISGCSDSIIFPANIKIGYPVNFSFTPENGCEDLAVQFSDISGIPADSVKWNFGDSNFSTDAAPNHLYLNAGCYQVSLTRYVNGCDATYKNISKCVRVYSTPNVFYSLDKNHSCKIPFLVKFSGLGNNIVKWDWDFGDNTTSNLQNPTHNYSTFGNFPVKLTVTDINGCTKIIQTDTVKTLALDAKVAGGQIQGCKPLTYTLADNSVTESPIISWFWQSGTQTSTAPNPTFAFPDTGYYDLKLIVTNASGCTDTSYFPRKFAVGQPQIVKFNADITNVCVENAVQFTDLSIGNFDTWLWNFGDGGTSIEQNPKYEYQDTGVFTVSLFVTQHGCASVLVVPNYINVVPPLSKFEVERKCETPFLIKFKNTSIGSDSLAWDFGVLNSITDTSMSQNPQFLYSDTGKYTITLTVFNKATLCKHSKALDLYITKPRAKFLATPIKGCAPLIIDLCDTSIFPISYKWISNGGIFSNDTIPKTQIRFDTAGKYTNLKLVIKDYNGCFDTFIYPDTIKVSNIVAGFSMSPNAGGCKPTSVQFQDTSINKLGIITNSNWLITNTLNDTIYKNSGLNTSFLFNQTGIYQILHTVTNSFGCQSTRYDSVEITTPIADFTADTLSCTSHEVNFINTSLGKNLTYLWDFGDTKTSIEASPKHLFQNEGNYSICLTVTDFFGCDSTLCLTNFIKIKNPKAIFSLDTNYLECYILEAKFNNLSQNAMNFTWNFGDNNQSNIINPRHTYTNSGIYTISLIASSNPFCADTLKIDSLIRLEAPEGTALYKIDTSCIPMNVTFYGNSASNCIFKWDYGYGNVVTNSIFSLKDTSTFSYNTVGRFFPKLLLLDSKGCQRPINMDSIQTADLQANFIISDTTLCGKGRRVSILNLSNSNLQIEQFNWKMNGGTPNFSQDIEPIIQYDSAGTFLISLQIANKYCRDTLTKNNIIRVENKPVADFTFNPKEGCSPLLINFQNQSLTYNGLIYKYLWNFGDNIKDSLNFNSSHTYTSKNDSTFNAKLIVASSIGCADTIRKEIKIFEPIDLQLFSSKDTICIGEQIQIRADIRSDTSGSTYFWQSNFPISCSNCLQPTIQPAQSANYTFNVTNKRGCTLSKTLQIYVRPFSVPPLFVTNDTIICLGTSISLSASGINDVFAYQWDSTRAGLNEYQNIRNPIASPSQTTTFVVTSTSTFGCRTTDSIRVEIAPLVLNIAGNDKTICLGDTARLFVNASNPHWLSGSGLSCTFCKDPVVKPLLSTLYAVEGIAGEPGCLSKDSVFVEVIDPKTVNAGLDKVVCLGDSVQLQAQGIGQINWTPISDFSNPNILNPHIKPIIDTKYFVTITKDKCKITDSLLVRVLTKTELFDTSFAACEGDTVRLNVGGTASKFTWKPSIGLSDANAENPIANLYESRVYQVIGGLNKCSEDTATVTVNILKKPKIDVVRFHPFYVGQTFDMGANNFSSGNFKYSWSPENGLSCTDCLNPNIIPDTSYRRYILKTTDIVTGCIAIDTSFIQKIENCTGDFIFVPNSFSPNADNINDILKVYSSNIENIRNFQVFDRWGNRLFVTKDFSVGWDGRFKEKVMDTGVYVWFVEAICPLDGSIILKKGDVTLIK